MLSFPCCPLIQIKLEFPAVNFPLRIGTRHFRLAINSLFQPVRIRCFLLTQGFPFRFPRAGISSVVLRQRLRVFTMVIAYGKLVMQCLMKIVVGF